LAPNLLNGVCRKHMCVWCVCVCVCVCVWYKGSTITTTLTNDTKLLQRIHKAATLPGNIIRLTASTEQ